MRIAIIQARMSSSRLFSKVLKPLIGKPLIWHVINRVRQSERVDDIVVATTNLPADDILVDWLEENSIPYFRGDSENVLSRYFHAAEHFKASTVVRITCDDPFKDPDVIDEMIDIFESSHIDLLTNNNPPSFPEGLDVEVFSFKALERAFNESKDLFEQEHVTQFFYRNPAKFIILNYSYKEDISHIRLTVDTIEDFNVAEKIYKHIYPVNPEFRLKDIVNCISSHPDVIEENKSIKRSYMYVKGTM